LKALVSLNQAFLAALVLAKKVLALIAAQHRPPCTAGLTLVTSVLCKLQEFPTVFVYLHAGVLPLLLALQLWRPFLASSSSGFGICKSVANLIRIKLK
jgi:hypothetical protein